MKLRNLFLASVACAGLFAACSNGIDEVIDNGNNETNNGEKAYASFAYTLPNGSASTRAALGTEVGTDEENAVNEIAFVLFKQNGDLIKVVTLGRSEFTPKDEESHTSYQTLNPISVTTDQNQKVYAIVNPSQNIKNFNSTEVNFKELVEGNFITTVASKNYFMMSNAGTVGTYTFSPNSKNTSTNPVKVEASVERMAARIDYTATQTDNEYTVVDTEDKVEIQKYRIVNKRTSAFLLKRVGTVIGAPEEANSYVMDPIFGKKSEEGFFKSASYNDGYTNKLTEMALDEYDNEFTNTKNTTKVLSYCHENTMSVNAQMTAAATGLIIKAKYTPKFSTSITANDNGDFYRRNGKLYPTLKEMYKALNTEWNGITKEGITDDVLGFLKSEGKDFDTFVKDFNFDKLKAYGIDFYAGGICYYTTFLRHINNNLPQEMGIMEYAIVRNNIYKLSINSVNKLGTPVPPTDPKPIEEKDSYLNVEVKVLGWTTRDNAVDL